jgi:hypothetical protein
MMAMVGNNFRVVDGLGGFLLGDIFRKYKDG